MLRTLLKIQLKNVHVPPVDNNFYIDAMKNKIKPRNIRINYGKMNIKNPRQIQNNFLIHFEANPENELAKSIAKPKKSAQNRHADLGKKTQIYFTRVPI